MAYNEKKVKAYTLNWSEGNRVLVRTQRTFSLTVVKATALLNMELKVGRTGYCEVFYLVKEY